MEIPKEKILPDYDSDEEYQRFINENLPETNVLTTADRLEYLENKYKRLNKEYYNLMKNQFLLSFKTETPHKCHWITINFNDKNVNHIIKELPTLFKRKILTKRCFNGLKYFFTVEQRSEELNKYHGYHIHLLSEKIPKPKGHIIREFYNALKDYISDKAKIDYKFYKGPTFWKDKLDYLKGIKDDSAKDLKTYNDKLFRVAYEIDELYFN